VFHLPDRGDGTFDHLVGPERLSPFGMVCRRATACGLFFRLLMQSPYCFFLGASVCLRAAAQFCPVNTFGGEDNWRCVGPTALFYVCLIRSAYSIVLRLLGCILLQGENSFFLLNCDPSSEQNTLQYWSIQTKPNGFMSWNIILNIV
jgi:hypothetical protein